MEFHKIFTLGVLGTNKKVDKAIDYLKEICEWQVKRKKINPKKSELRELDLAIITSGEEDLKTIRDLIWENIPCVFVETKNTSDFAVLEVRDEDYKTLGTLFYLLFKNRRLRRFIVKKQGQGKKQIRIQIEGSFDSSYSLAVVNRNLALALERLYPGEISLYSTDGYGDFEPNQDFLDNHPEVKELWKRSEKNLHCDLVLRNPYPPRVVDMKGLINVLSCYGWEESEYPKEYLEDFELALDLVTVMSPYVKKVLEDNGLSLPVFVAGLGLDHLDEIEPKDYSLKTKKSFKFLHLSSCFPRKGIDVLLDAYFESFSGDDDCVLIIKTFPNPHHNIEKMIEDRKKNKINPPEVELINRDLEDGYVKDLYLKSQVVVLPSRGEGFLLPAGEAMWFKKPVITTGFGGQMLFCNKDNAWLLPYTFKKAKTHFDLPFSYFAEPDKDTLKKYMRWFYELGGSSPEIEKKVQLAYENIKNFTWKRVAEKLMAAVEEVKERPVFEPRPIKVGLLSSWNCRCGIAGYAQRLVENFSFDLETYVFANKVPEEEIKDLDKERNVKRTWIRIMKNEEVRQLVKEILEQKIKIFILQHHYAFFDTYALKLLLEELIKHNIKVFITIHCLKTEDAQESLKNIAPTLGKIHKILVHSLEDLNSLLSWGVPWEKIALFPHGIQDRRIQNQERNKLREKWGLADKIVIGSFGFLRPHKGVKELIEAFYELRRDKKLADKKDKLHLWLINSLYPSEDSEQEFKKVQQVIKKYQLEKMITLKTDFVPEQDIARYISVMDICVFAYQNTEESSSAAVREAIGSGVKVLCTPLKIFSDVEDVVYFSEHISSESVARAIANILVNEELEEERLKKLDKFLQAASWQAVGKRMEGMIKNAFYNL